MFVIASSRKDKKMFQWIFFLPFQSFQIDFASSFNEISMDYCKCMPEDHETANHIMKDKLTSSPSDTPTYFPYMFSRKLNESKCPRILFSRKKLYNLQRDFNISKAPGL